MAAGTLITLGGNLEDPRNSKASDYSPVGPSGAAGSSSGSGQLVKQTVEQEGPRHTNDSGENTPSTWGSEDKGFTVQVNKGEGAGQSSLSYKGSVDFNTGQMSPESVDQKY